MMDRQAHREELLDGRLDDAPTLAGNLRDLARVNRWLGGSRLSASGVEALSRGRSPVSVLDVGTGGADIPLALIDRARASGRTLIVTGIDSRPEVLAAAVMVHPRLTATDGLALQIADGRSLPYPDDSFDVVHSSLLVHHLDPDAARAVLTEMARVARLGVVLNDLVRSRPAWIGAWLLSHTLTRNRFTRTDAPLSVRRAYTVAELTALLATAGLRVGSIVRAPFAHRVALIALGARGVRGADR